MKTKGGSGYAVSLQSRLSRNLLDRSNGVDELFATERLDEEGSRTRARLRGGFQIQDGDGLRFLQGANIAPDLPSSERQSQVVLANTFESRDLSSDSQDRIQPQENNDSFQTGLRFFPVLSGPVRGNFDRGLRRKGGPDPFLQTRLRYVSQPGKWFFTPTQFLFWRQSDGGFRSTTRLYVDRQFESDVLLRFRSQGTISEDSRGLEYDNSVTAFVKAEMRWD